jgi:predicted CoA-binding protein
MKDIAELLEEPETTIAIVGATDNPAKYGSVIYRDLKRKGYAVYAVNPNRETVDGDPCYPNLAALPRVPTIANFVVPPAVTLEVLEEARALGILAAWIQPGAESPEVLAYLQEHGFEYLANACIMVESRLRSGA